MLNGGGSMFLESTARFIGPGQAGIINDNGTNWLTYHYYDGNNARHRHARPRPADLDHQ